MNATAGHRLFERRGGAWLALGTRSRLPKQHPNRPTVGYRLEVIDIDIDIYNDNDIDKERSEPTNPGLPQAVSREELAGIAAAAADGAGESALNNRIAVAPKQRSQPGAARRADGMFKRITLASSSATQATARRLPSLDRSLLAITIRLGGRG